MNLAVDVLEKIDGIVADLFPHLLPKENDFVL